MLTFAATLLAAPHVSAQTASGVIPIGIAAGESVTLDRPLAKGDDVFELRARAGQTLALEVEDSDCPSCTPSEPRPVDEVRVFLVGTTPPQDLPTPEDFGECVDWRWMNVLPTSGIYRIVVSKPSEERYRLRVSLLDPHDPIFDPGITADRVSIGQGLFPPGSKLTLVRFNPADYLWSCGVHADFDEGLPAHLTLQDKHAWLGVMSLDGLKKANPDWIGYGALAELERATRPGAAAVNPPFGIFDDAHLSHWGKLDRFEAKSWRGLRWLAQFCQDNCAVHNPLMYMFAATSIDGKYFIWLWVDADYLNPPLELFQLSDEQSAQLGDEKVWETFQSKVNVALTNAPAKSFKPDLDQLDAFVHSIELR